MRDPPLLVKRVEGPSRCWGETKARELLAEAGFASAEVAPVEGDPFNLYFVCRRSA